MSERESLPPEEFVRVNLTNDGMVETLWAVRVGEERFELPDSPFFAYRISDNDMVEGVEISPGVYEFSRIVQPSGNRTIRMLLEPDTEADTDAGEAILVSLEPLGCNYENMNRRLISVIVPPSVDLRQVAEYVVGTGLQWEYANPTYEDLFG